MNEESFAIELQNTFLSEAQEMLEDTETAFMQIEADPGDTAKIDKIFRLVHTIKGSAHVAGFSDLGVFAHTFETLLSALRERKLEVTTDITDVLLAGNDCLAQFVRALKENKIAKVDTSKMELRIKACLSRAVVPPPLHPPKQSEPPKQPGPPPQATKANAKKAASSDLVTTNHPASAHQHHGTSPAFLICDDDSNLLEIVDEYLASSGYKVVLADSAEKALEIFKTQQIDVIFTDLKMPGMDGIEFITAVRSINEFVSIVVVSGHSYREHFKEYIKLRVDAFIEKPFSPEEVLRVADRVVHQRHLHEAVLSLSRLSFRAFVSIEKILFLASQSDINLNEKVRLDAIMQDIRQATAKLLESEKLLKR